LALAAEDGWLAHTDHGWRVVADPLTEEAAVLHQNLVARFPDFGADLQLARRCATGLPGVLRGETDPLELLFGGEAAQLTERLYEQSPPARFYNEALARAVEALVRRLPAGRPIRVLELGAGTGGTTAHLLPMLPVDRTEYVFTDVSPLFLAAAREKFGAYTFVRYQRLDLESDPAGQGFAEHDFDLVVAANVFHATADLRRSVRHARQLLGPSGVLVLLEGTGPRRLLDLIFGLTDGWWRFADADLRPDYPLISADRWARLLADEGFGQVACLPAPDAAMPDPDQVVILALGPSGVARSARPAIDRNDAPQVIPVAEALATASADRAALRAAPPAERRALLEDFLRREFAAVAGVRLSDDELGKPLHAFGLDSLMAMQLRNRVESGLGVSLSLVQVLRGLSLRELVDDALRTLATSDPLPAEPAPDRLRLAGLAAEQVDALPVGELDSLLHSLLEHAGGPQPAASGAYNP
jgi:SAM-dependent methyltransferase